MAPKSETRKSSWWSRRQFLQRSAAAYGGLSLLRSAHAAGSDVIKIGLIGCGSRGTGAAMNALGADRNCQLVALADAFEDRLQSSLKAIQKQMGEKVAVQP
ncbi:MAG: twin-arginine translocation signal domain-containing protein, partial [Candidatus Margulisiibacteriota bacterium]